MHLQISLAYLSLDLYNEISRGSEKTNWSFKINIVKFYSRFSVLNQFSNKLVSLKKDLRSVNSIDQIITISRDTNWWKPNTRSHQTQIFKFE